uniref:Signal sequence receptor subunit alpha n=1 Tax=Panagrellus redivivus TaxID=6233 RepID=A0A7E4WCE1_PANRE
MAVCLAFSIVFLLLKLTSTTIIKPTDPLPESLADKIAFNADGSITLLTDSTHTVFRNPESSFIFAINVKPGANGRADLCVEGKDESAADDRTLCKGLILEVNYPLITVKFEEMSVNHTIIEDTFEDFARIYFGFYFGSQEYGEKWMLFITNDIINDDYPEPMIANISSKPFKAVSHTNDGSYFEFKVTNKISNVELQMVGVDYVTPTEETTTEILEIFTWEPKSSKLNAQSSVAISLCVVLAVILVIQVIIIYKFSDYLVWPPTKLAKAALANNNPAASTSRSQIGAGSVDPSPKKLKTPTHPESTVDNPSAPPKKSKFSKVKKLFNFRKKPTNQP